MFASPAGRVASYVALCACLAVGLPVRLGAQEPVADVPSTELPPSPLDTAALDTELTLDPAVRAGVLDNGLRYFVRANDEPEDRADLRLVVDAGSVRTLMKHQKRHVFIKWVLMQLYLNVNKVLRFHRFRIV
jgi:hypothetical protein